MSKSDSFLINVIKLMGGSVIAQALGIIAAPIITRIYGPASYGISTLFASITAIIVVVACLRYEMSIMLPEKDEDAASMLVTSLLLVCITTLLVSLFVFFLREQIAYLLKAPELAKYLWLTPFMVFISGIFLALNYWNSRTKEFGRLSATRIVASVGTVSTQLGMGFGGQSNAGGLINGQVIGKTISCGLLSGLIWRKDRKIIKKGFRREKIWQGIKRYKKFPLFDTWSALLNTVSIQIPSFLLAYFFSPTVVGYYALSVNLLSMPANLVGSAFAQVFYQKAAEANHNNTLDIVTEKVLTSLVSLGMFPILLLAVAGKEIVLFFFGAGWAEAGVYAQILSIWIFSQFLYSPISTIFCVLEKQKDFLQFNIILFIIRIFSVSIGGLLHSPRLSLLLLSLGSSLYYLTILNWVLTNSGVNKNRCYKTILQVFLYCIPMIIFVFIAKYLLIIKSILLIIIACAFAIPYYLIVMPKIIQVE
jgi:lipopolysaccharide exporter